MLQSPPVVLTIAGFDPSSGAGATADIKTIAAHGCYGVAALTALTVQSTSGVRRCEAVDPAMLRETLDELKQDTKISAVHIGMLASAAVATVVAIAVEFLGSIALILGVWTRPLAVLLALFTLATAILAHHFWTMEGAERYANSIHFYKNLSIIGGFLLLYVTGAGKYSVDARLGLTDASPLRPPIR